MSNEKRNIIIIGFIVSSALFMAIYLPPPGYFTNLFNYSPKFKVGECIMHRDELPSRPFILVVGIAESSYVFCKGVHTVDKTINKLFPSGLKPLWYSCEKSRVPFEMEEELTIKVECPDYKLYPKWETYHKKQLLKNKEEK